MVVALGPGKFYGSSLPRPRIYTDIKYNSYRVDPPVSVIDPFMSWAEEAHWSMGGLSFQHHRLQGRIEGNVEKLRNQIDKSFIKKEAESASRKLDKKKFVSKALEKSSKKKKKEVERNRSPSPPPAPLANKRKRRYVGLVDEDEEENEGVSVVKKWPVRKLSDEFDLVADAKKGGGESTVALRTRGRKAVTEEAVKTVEKGKKRLRKVGDVSVSPSRISPRLVKSG